MFLKPLRDIDVRVPLRALVRREFPTQSVFLEEMVVPGRDSRIDLAVVNGSLHGFEIKSETDTLRRLPSQRDSYNALFDRMTLVVASRHVQKAVDLIPAWWGLAVANRDGRRVCIEWSRRPTDNPNPNTTTALKLLWRDEVERIVTDEGLCSAAHKYYVYELSSMLLENLSSQFLRGAVRSALKKRHGVD